MTHLPTITRDELKTRLDRGDPITLVEALPEGHYRQAHLPGALHLPPDRIRELTPRLLPDQDATIVVYCSSLACRHSSVATATLLKMGYRDVRAYEGGKSDWMDAGLPTERGAPPPLPRDEHVRAFLAHSFPSAPERHDG